MNTFNKFSCSTMYFSTLHSFTEQFCVVIKYVINYNNITERSDSFFSVYLKKHSYINIFLKFQAFIKYCQKWVVYMNDKYAKKESFLLSLVVQLSISSHYDVLRAVL